MREGCSRARSPIGWLALHWRLDGRRWLCTGIDLPPDSRSMRSRGDHPRAQALLAALLDPRRRVPARALEQLERKGLSDFRWLVLRTLAESVPPSHVISYGGLAELCGRPRAARAVASAMRNNPFPLLIPCHRVIAAGGRIGGFQAGIEGGIERKRRLLEWEGVRFEGDRLASGCLLD